MKVKVCEKCGYQYVQASCPACDPQPVVKLTTEEHIARLTDTQVQFIFQNGWWEQGDAYARQLCLDEFDKRLGLENWPAHISREVE